MLKITTIALATALSLGVVSHASADADMDYYITHNQLLVNSPIEASDAFASVVPQARTAVRGDLKSFLDQNDGGPAAW